jgi:queuine tRNA-ribosyltransferase
MSLTGLRKLTEKGVIFRSHIDGSEHQLTPERSMDIQRMLDSDITMALDECTPHPSTHEQTATSLALSMRWAARSKAAFAARPGYGLFGIVQGGIYLDLRSRSVADLLAIGFDGYAVGGLAVGEGQDTMFAVLDHTTPLLPADRPRYLMGVGTPADLVGGVARGIDMFDCVMPTRSGRTGQAFTRRGKVNMRNARHLDDPRPLDEACRCPACRQFSRAYLHHLQRSEEMLGAILLTWHNLTYYQDLMAGMREAIAEGRFQAFCAAFAEAQALGDIAQVSIEPP